MAGSREADVKTILVVDDELENAQALALILQEEGYRVLCAGDGRQGLEQAKALRPHLVILDFMMPVMNGADMARSLREDPATRDIPILVNSSLPEWVVREHFAGYDHFLRKPFDVTAALGVVSQLLRA
jgi:CheY-like chemotaxis protein